MIRKTYIRKVEARLVELEEDIGRLQDRVPAPVGDGIKDLGRAIDETIEKVRKTGSGIR